MSGRVWFLGQTPPPVEATQDELDSDLLCEQGLVKLADWLQYGDLTDLEDTAPTPRGAVYPSGRMDLARVDATTEAEIEAQAAQDDAEAEADARRYAASRGAVYLYADMAQATDDELEAGSSVAERRAESGSGQGCPKGCRQDRGYAADRAGSIPAPPTHYRTTEGAAVPSLEELLAAARNHVMSPEEREAQRQSFTRGQLAMGNDRDEAEYRRKMRADSIDYETPGD